MNKTIMLTKQLKHKIYIIIDEYDNFTNGILEGNTTIFKNIVGENGFVKSFYAIIKEYIGMGIVDRFYATGICPITLNSITTGFNISIDISTDPRFNSMIGLTHEEVKTMYKNFDLTELEEKEIYTTMKKNYDGYLFSKDSEERVFNATLVMYLLNNYQSFKKIPETLTDKNITGNYGKIENIIKIQNNEIYKEIISEILETNEITGSLKNEVNINLDITKDDIISLLYYFGYLTIEKIDDMDTVFKIPNLTTKETYNNYFIKILNENNILIDNIREKRCIKEISENYNIEKITKYVSEILKETSNRILIKFDEKYISLLYYTLLRKTTKFHTYLEYPSNNGYIDIFIEGNKKDMNRNILIELKYIKKSDYNETLIKEKYEESKMQVNKYSSDLRLENPIKYIVIFVGNDVKYLEKI